MMKIIGLTGGIGSGKSTVANFLADLGAIILDADKVGHEALKPGSAVWQQVVNEFGKSMVTASGDIDRARLGRLVFGNPDARANLNRIMHPPMYDIIKSQLEKYRGQGVKVLVLEAPLLVEAGWTSLVDEVWVTVAPEPTVLQRLRERAGLSEKEARARIQTQLSNKERMKHADIVIDTNSSLIELKTKVKGLWLRLQEQNGTNSV